MAFNLSAASVASPATVDIVFLHGLGGSASDSWVHNGTSGQAVYWPALLGDALPSANVSVVGYPTSKLGKVLGGTDIGILTAAAGVADLLVGHGLGARPIFFVCHSLGGIVAKAVLRICADSTDPIKRRIFDSTQGIVFFGTPNGGASMGTICSRLPGLVAMQAAELSRADELLMNLGQWFRGKAGPDKIRALAFYETETLNGLLVVDASSANPAVAGCDPAPIAANHVTMCKLPSRDHAAFVRVQQFIASTCSDRGLPLESDGEEDASSAKLKQEYLQGLFVGRDLRHPLVPIVDERKIFVDPNIYHENSKTRITTLEQLLTTLLDTEAAVISGNDRAGKTLLSKLIQAFFDERGRAAIRVDGGDIGSADVLGLIERSIKQQYGDVRLSNATIIVDDFDECQLPDAVKERIVSDILKTYDALIITSFTHAPSVLFAPSDRPDPDLFDISPLGDEKLFELVVRWKRIGLESEIGRDEKLELATFELLRKIFNQTEVEKFPGAAVSFLQLIDSSAGSDINHSSYAACYETLITSHIGKVRPNWQNLDEARNFVSFVAFTAYQETHRADISTASLDTCLKYYEQNYFSSRKELRAIVVDGFLTETEDGFRFREEYEWYFLVARHAANVLKNGPEYETFVIECTSNIFMKQYANMVIFMAYFTTDNMILALLLEMLDGLFIGAPSWTLSDEQKTIMLGLTSTDQLAVQSRSDNSEDRSRILRERVVSIIDEAEHVVAQYTLPFINPDIDDSEYVQQITPDSIDEVSYMKSLNALMRVHSVIGQILASRSGTFSAQTMLDCITRMVKASGRYIHLNHAISAVLVYDKDNSLEEVDRAYDNNRLSREQKYEKVER